MGREDDQDARAALGWLRRGWSAIGERRGARRVCRKLLALHAEAAREHGELSGESLYELIIARS